VPPCEDLDGCANIKDYHEGTVKCSIFVLCGQPEGVSFLLHKEMQVHNLHIQFISETLIHSTQTEAVKMSVAGSFTCNLAYFSQDFYF
jgi:hypothetical protein